VGGGGGLGWGWGLCFWKSFFRLRVTARPENEFKRGLTQIYNWLAASSHMATHPPPQVLSVDPAF